MSDPFPGTSNPPRTRKRILDPADAHEDDNNARRPSLFNADWQEAFKHIDIPHKKGYTGLDSFHKRQSEDINQSLADNFEDSLSGLGVDISTAMYNMSEPIMALPTIDMFKQENGSILDKPVVSPINSLDENSQSNSNSLFKLLSVESLSQAPLPLTQILHPLSPPYTSYGSTSIYNSTSPSPDPLFSSAPLSISEVCSISHDDQERFQYILGAATSIATKINEESLTYLNQGQSYEIKVKKLGDLTRCQGTLYHTVLRICFHERRLQNTEKEQLQNWQQMRPGERIIEIDTPLSYGISDVVQDSTSLNVCEFDWEPTKEVGVYVKVNCISTEFTPKKHGGEKGVPFRIQIETYSKTEVSRELHHVCACQIKVFKLKGADRKHKQEREKVSKRDPKEQEKYQKSCDCTILSELSPESAYIPPLEISDGLLPHPSPPPPIATSPTVKSTKPDHYKSASTSQSSSQEEEEDLDTEIDNPYFGKLLLTNANPNQTQTWLSVNRFSKHSLTFSNFGGADLLRLSRDELIQLCGLADGIRLFNCLHFSNSLVRLTLYVRVNRQQLYNAIYLENVTCQEFITKISTLINIPSDNIYLAYLQVPSGIHILVTDEVIRNMKNETPLTIEQVLDSNNQQRYCLLIKMLNCPIKKEQMSPPS